jgi:hypothetical protein
MFKIIKFAKYRKSVMNSINLGIRAYTIQKGKYNNGLVEVVLNKASPTPLPTQMGEGKDLGVYHSRADFQATCCKFEKFGQGREGFENHQGNIIGLEKAMDMAYYRIDYLTHVVGSHYTSHSLNSFLYIFIHAIQVVFYEF